MTQQAFDEHLHGAGVTDHVGAQLVHVGDDGLHVAIALGSRRRTPGPAFETAEFVLLVHGDILSQGAEAANQVELAAPDGGGARGALVPYGPHAGR